MMLKRERKTPAISRRAALKIGAGVCGAMIGGCMELRRDGRAAPAEFDVRKFGAVGDGVTPDTAAIQTAIIAAANYTGSGRPRVLIPGGKKYLIGTVRLAENIDFHLADDAELLVSIQRNDYDNGRGEAAIVARSAQGLCISGTGSVNGRSPEIMKVYNAKDEWYFPIPNWRPRLLVLTGCSDLEVRDVTLKQASQWTLHLVGCRRVVVDGIRIRNQLDVPNCDGIDPDHCLDVEIKNCDIVCGDDAIVIKTTRLQANFNGGEGSARIHVKDCVIETQDAGVKIGTETTRDIKDVVFERCRIKTSSRGMGIQLRDEGNVSNIVFRDIEFTSRYYSDPWWGRGEAISLTAIPRVAGGAVGRLENIRFENVTGHAENSMRIEGSAQSRVKNVRLENVAVTLDRWTRYGGGGSGRFDNRPTKAQADIEMHSTPGFSVRHADDVALRNCSVQWGANVPEYFSNAVLAEDVTGLVTENFKGTAAHAGEQAIVSK